MKSPFCLVALLLFGAGYCLEASAQRLNDTGLIICYDASSSTGTVAPATPDPETAGFDEQDCTRGAAAADALGRMVKVGGSSAPGRDYTKIANDGRVLPASATLGSGPGDWGCTRDNITGLIWEVKTTLGLRSQSHTYAWYDTNSALNGGNPGTEASAGCGGTLPNCNTTAYRNAINALTGAARLCGATDWRLPTPMELRSLVHLGASNPAIDSTWLPNTSVAVYWTGMNYSASATGAWSTLNGDLRPDLKSSRNGVRLVRGGR